MSKTFTHTILTEGQLKTTTDQIVDAATPTSTVASTVISPFPFTMSIADSTVHGKAGTLVPLSVYLERNGVLEAFTLKLGYGTSDANFYVTNTYNSFSAARIDASFMLASTEPDLTKKFLWFQAAPESTLYRAVSGPVLIAGSTIQGYITVDPAQIGQTAPPVVPTVAPTVAPTGSSATTPKTLNITVIAPKVNNLFILVGNSATPDLPVVSSGEPSNNSIGKTLSVQLLNQTVQVYVNDSSSHYKNLVTDIVITGNTDRTIILEERYFLYTLNPTGVYNTPVTVTIYKDGAYNSSYTFTGQQSLSLPLGNYTFNFSASGYNNTTLSTNESQVSQIDFTLTRSVITGSFSVAPYIIKLITKRVFTTDPADGPPYTTLTRDIFNASFPLDINNVQDSGDNHFQKLFMRFSMDSLPVGAVVTSLVLSSNLGVSNSSGNTNNHPIVIGHTYLDPNTDATTAFNAPVDAATSYATTSMFAPNIYNFVLAIPSAIVPYNMLITNDFDLIGMSNAVLKVSWTQ